MKLYLVMLFQNQCKHLDLSIVRWLKTKIKILFSSKVIAEVLVMRFTPAMLFMCTCIHSNAYAIEQQESERWAWAACVQDVVLNVGYYGSQKQFAENLNLQRFSRPFANDVMSVLESYGLKVSEDERPYKPNELGDYFNDYSKLIALVKKGGSEQCIVLEGRDAMGDILIADPVTGLSYRQSAKNLYYTWNWETLIVVKRCNTSMKCID